ncbi:MAG: PIN domain-containing protein [Candidatus Margulisbacteria bacterium]|nr:PIN domain-containing protein [Candidatus Margulisiibacteriota bacterium]
MKLLDTNVIIRFLTRDDKRKAKKCRILFEKVLTGELKLFITNLAVAEVVWVLEKVYKLSKRAIRLNIEAILNTPNLVFQNRGIISESIILYDIHGIDFINVYHKIYMLKSGIKEIYSYDKDFDMFADIVRIEP